MLHGKFILMVLELSVAIHSSYFGDNAQLETITAKIKP